MSVPNPVFNLAVSLVLELEGGLHTDPKDPGGTTAYGWAQKMNPDIDVTTLTRETAIARYRDKKWDHLSCDQLPGSIAVILFDSAINQGDHAAVSILQTALKLNPDGGMGPLTIAAAIRQPGKEFLARLVARRNFHYAYNGGSFNPLFVDDGDGWMVRSARMHQLAMQFAYDAGH